MDGQGICMSAEVSKTETVVRCGYDCVTVALSKELGALGHNFTVQWFGRGVLFRVEEFHSMFHSGLDVPCHLW
jgi:hypothetical protein